MTVYSSKEKAGLEVDVVIANGEASRLQTDQEESDITSKALAKDKSLWAHAYYLFTVFGRSVCYDINVGHKERLISQAFFLDRDDMTKDPGKAVEVIEAELNFIYDMVHTKEPVAHTPAGWLLRTISSACLVASVVAFYLHDKRGIKRVDVDITCALLLGALALDVTSLVMLFFSSNWTMVALEVSSLSSPVKSRLRRIVRLVRRLCPELGRWSKTTSQLNLINYSLEKSKREHALNSWTRLAKVVAYKLRAGPVFDECFFVRRENPASFIDFIFNKLKHTAEFLRNPNNYDDIEAMRKASSYRGEMAISATRAEMETTTTGTTDEPLVEIDWHKLMDSVRIRDFHESLLMWHIATDLCCISIPPSKPSTAAAAAEQRATAISISLSEYMLYLLVMQPKVLAASAGVGQVAYQDTCAEARRLFRSATVHCDPNHEDARRMLLSTCTSVPPEVIKGGRSKSVLFPACIVAKELRKLGDEARSKLLAGVWMEMLTYAAAKCKGTTHLHNLARGGELITVVWLLMTHMGIGNIYQKTVADDPTSKLIIRDQ